MRGFCGVSDDGTELGLQSVETNNLAVDNFIPLFYLFVALFIAAVTMFIIIR